MKIALVCRGSKVFIDPLIKHWQNQGYTFTDSIYDADVVFCEWGNEQSVEVTNRSQRKNIVIRVHGSEYFQGFHTLWNKSKIHSVIKANPKYEIPGVNVIDCGIPIDVAFWNNKPNQIKRDSKRLIVAGSFTYSKNHIGLLNMIAENPTFFSEVVFVGDIEATDNAYRKAETKKTLTQIKYLSAKYNIPLKICDTVDRQTLREMYWSSEWVVSNSTNEGFHLSIAEGILCGCVPLIYDWMGAKEIYDTKTFVTSRDFWNLVNRDEQSSIIVPRLQKMIIDKYSEENVFSIIDDAIFEAAREWM